MAPNYYIGTSGWHYDHWRHLFYPEGLAKARWLEFYAGHFTTVELNSSFYRLPSEAAFAAWYDSSPANFTFAVKVSRFITHIKRLRDTEEAVGKFRAAVDTRNELDKDFIIMARTDARTAVGGSL